jgi:hypothetical protein
VGTSKKKEEKEMGQFAILHLNTVPKSICEGNPLNAEAA